MKKIALYLASATLILSSIVIAFSPTPAKAYSNSRLIDNSVFDNVNSMSESQIHDFLGSKGPCLVNYGSEDFHWNGSSWSYGGTVSAAHIIAKAAQFWGINPQVLITTLQKEESLVSGTSCDGWRYNSAMGYGCPDSGGCNAKYAGFTKQVLWGSWQLKFNKERSQGNVAWDDDGDITYVGFMTAGTYKRCNGCSPTYFNGYATIDGQQVYLDNGATASLYTYTPHLGQSFPGIFESWFGSTLGYCSGANVPGAGFGEKIMSQKMGGGDSLTLGMLNLTGTGCIEAHTWTNATGQQWLFHGASNRPSVDPADAEMVAADTNGDGRDELFDVEYSHTSSGRIEIHGWSPDLLRWTSHIATNRPAINHADAQVMATDRDHDGRDEFYLVQYRNTSSGMIEVHGWTPSLQQWSLHAATNRIAINPADANIIATNNDLLLVEYRNNGTGMVEIHGWSPNFQQWTLHAATNRVAIDPDDAQVVSANNQLLLVQYSNTASGRVEVHGWTPSLQQWNLHAATNQGSF